MMGGFLAFLDLKSVKWVQPKNLLAAQFMLFSLKSIRAIGFMEKTDEQLWFSFSVGEKKNGGWLLAVGSSFLEQ